MLADTLRGCRKIACILHLFSAGFVSLSRYFLAGAIHFHHYYLGKMRPPKRALNGLRSQNSAEYAGRFLVA